MRGGARTREEKGRPNYNLWKKERMKGALEEYREGVKKGIRNGCVLCPASIPTGRVTAA